MRSHRDLKLTHLDPQDNIPGPPSRWGSMEDSGPRCWGAFFRPDIHLVFSRKKQKALGGLAPTLGPLVVVCFSKQWDSAWPGHCRAVAAAPL